MIDLHLHSRFSFDSEELPENFVKRAIDVGAPALGFSEHYDLDAYYAGANIGLADIPIYIDNVNALRAKYPQIEILCGIEYGFSMDAIRGYKATNKMYKFDYVINSLHTIPGRGDCAFSNFFKDRTVKESFVDYLKAVHLSVLADYDFEIVGHIGYVTRYCKCENNKIVYSEFADILDEILKTIIKRDKCLEINTSVGKSLNCFLPDKDVIKRYLELGGKLISFGSDAHCADDYLRRKDECCDFLKSIGVSQLCYFKDRKPVMYKI